MRILHIIRTINPEAGGPSESVRLLTSYRDLGYRGEIVTLDDPNAPFLRALSIPVHALGPVNSTYGYSSKLVPWMKENRFRFDGAVVNGLWSYGGIAAWRALHGYLPYMVFPHGMLDPYFKRAFPLKHFKKWLYWAPLEYRVLRDAYRVLFTSEAERQLAEETFWLHRWKARVVPYGADVPHIDPAMALGEFYSQQPQLRDKRFLLFLGRVHPKKGVDLLVKAFVQTAASDPKLDLVIAGPDATNWRPELQAMVDAAGLGGRVHWPGMLRGPLKWGAFYACEAFILPSHQENFGIAVAEAMACGRPVLLSDQVNIAPDIAMDEAGYMQPATLEGTVNLLRAWIETPQEQREMMSARALSTFHTRYDMRESAKAILALFEQAATGR